MACDPFWQRDINEEPTFKSMVDEAALDRGLGDDDAARRGRTVSEMLRGHEERFAHYRADHDASVKRSRLIRRAKERADENTFEALKRIYPDKYIIKRLGEVSSRFAPLKPIYDCQHMTMKQALEQSATAKAEPARPRGVLIEYSEEGGY